jgi:hypothetical protein
MYVLISSTTISETFLIIRKIQGGMIINVNSYNVKYPLFLSDFNKILFFLPQIFEKSSNIKFRENPSSGNRVLVSGRTDMKKPILAFRNFFVT